MKRDGVSECEKKEKKKRRRRREEEGAEMVIGGRTDANLYYLITPFIL